MPELLQKNWPEEYQPITLVNNDRYFYTHDLGCSAALISVGFELVSLSRANPKKVQFIFHRKIGVEKAVDDYWADRLEVKARTFFDNMKMLKNQIYSE